MLFYVFYLCLKRAAWLLAAWLLVVLLLVVLLLVVWLLVVYNDKLIKRVFERDERVNELSIIVYDFTLNLWNETSTIYSFESMLIHVYMYNRNMYIP